MSLRTISGAALSTLCERRFHGGTITVAAVGLSRLTSPNIAMPSAALYPVPCALYSAVLVLRRARYISVLASTLFVPDCVYAILL
jgi:hypothetical protein